MYKLDWPVQIGGHIQTLGDVQTELCEPGPIYSAPAENTDAQTASWSAPCDAPTLEDEITALVQTAAYQARAQTPQPVGVLEESDLQVESDWTQTDQPLSRPFELFELRVKEAQLERNSWDPEIRISDADRVAHDGGRGTRAPPVMAAIVATLGVTCIIGLAAYYFDPSASIPAKDKPMSPARSAGLSNPVVDISPDASRHVSPGTRKSQISPPVPRMAAQPGDPAQRRDRRASSSTSASHVQSATQPAAPAVQQTSALSSRPTPFPETRPTTLQGWTIRDVVAGVATVQGPAGVWQVKRGDVIPGLGTVDSIVRWGNRWIVATGAGLVSTP